MAETRSVELWSVLQQISRIVTEHLPQKKVTNTQANVLTYVAAGKAEILPASVKAPDSCEVAVETRHSAISIGTERLVFNSLVPESQWQVMRCPNQVGDFSYPVAYGYSCVGQVVDVGSDVTNCDVGDHVFVLHPHQDRFVVAAESCRKIPSHIPIRRAVLAANMETALNAVWDSEIETQPNSNALIVGAGVVGCLTGFAVRQITGKSPLVIDINENKRPVVESLGLEFATVDEVSKTNRHEFDHVFNTSASAHGLQLAIDLSGFEGSIVEMSWYGERPVELKLGGHFHSKRLKIISSQVGHIARTKRDEIDYAQRMWKALELLDAQELDGLLENPISFMSSADILPALFNDQKNVLCQVIDYDHNTGST